MAGTAQKTMNSATWVALAAAAVSGFFQNTSKVVVLVSESVGNPGTGVKTGHEYKSGEKDTFTATIGLWGRIDPNQKISRPALLTSATVTVTEY